MRCGGAGGDDAAATLAVSHLSLGRDGPWAVNLWARQANNSGDAFQYLLSTRTPAGMMNDSVFQPNQARRRRHAPALHRLSAGCRGKQSGVPHVLDRHASGQCCGPTCPGSLHRYQEMLHETPA